MILCQITAVALSITTSLHENSYAILLIVVNFPIYFLSFNEILTFTNEQTNLKYISMQKTTLNLHIFQVNAFIFFLQKLKETLKHDYVCTFIH